MAGLAYRKLLATMQATRLHAEARNQPASLPLDCLGKWDLNYL
jgi:hypothetical protein